MTPPKASGASRQDAATDGKLKEEVIAATKRLDNAQSKTRDAAKELGLLLIEAKRRHPAVKDFEAFLKDAGGIKLTRAYELIGVAGGRIESAKLREDNAKRNREHRAKKKAAERERFKALLKPGPEPEPPPQFPSRDGKPEFGRIEGIEEHDPEHVGGADQSPEEREHSAWLDAADKAQEASAHALAEYTDACRKWLPKITEQHHRKKAQAARAQMFNEWKNQTKEEVL
jgi:hypothetical protein